MGLRERANRQRATTLAEHVRSRHLLLVLDNCEHLLDQCAALVDELLRRAPKLHVLATSRQPLRVAGESVLAVPPLSVPDPDRIPSAEALAQYEAVNLFLDRATAALPSFELTADNHEAISRLCHALDGMPLALELAAVRLRAFSPEEILARLNHPYALLTTGSRSAPKRQQSLRASLDWSFELCSVEERTLWSRLAVFSGGFELDAAEDICSGDSLSREAVFDLVASLVEKSILLREEHGAVVRYRLLETIRGYAEQHLDGGELATWRRRHRDWYSNLVACSASDWISPNQAAHVARLKREAANLRVALDFCTADPDESVVGLQMATAMARYWELGGHGGEARYWLDALLANGAAPAEVRAGALCVGAFFATGQGDIEDATAKLDEAEVLARRSTESRCVAMVHRERACVAAMSGDLHGAIELVERAIPMFEAAGDLSGELTASTFLGHFLAMSGDSKAAAVVYQGVVAATEARSEVALRCRSLWGLGVAAWVVGDKPGAAAFVHECLRVMKDLDDRSLTGLCLEVLAWVAATDYDGERAATLLSAAETIWRTMGSSLVAAGPPLLAYHADAIAAARRSGERAFQVGWRRGTALALDEAVAFALDENAKPRSAKSSSEGKSTKLTEREMEVANLVAQGLTNRDIAERLVIAQRTAEGHVEHVLSKLGFTSRAQIAAWAAGGDDPAG
jgi:non-specific serine/threonine protein kinase